MPVPRSAHLVLPAVLAVLVAACGASGGEPSSAPSTPTPAPSASPRLGASALPPASSVGGAVDDPSVLVGRSFLSTAIAGRALVPNSQVRLAFQGDNLGAHAGCNSMSGSYTITDGVLRIGQMAMTEMACDRPLMDQDTWLAGFLDGAALSLEGTTLTLENDGA